MHSNAINSGKIEGSRPERVDEMELIHRVEQIIQEEKLVQPGDTIVVAVSGGPDSVALLHLLHRLSVKWDLHLIVAHVNHQFRGEESDLEADAVREWSSRLQLDYQEGTINVPEYIKQQGMNAQEAARVKRYEFLVETAQKYGAAKIALAHQADDQAETMLMRLIRGTGPSGLTGIPIRRVEKNVELIRPLLRIYKADIMSYIAANDLHVCWDSSNAQRKYFRNRIRLDVLPYLMQYNGQLPQSLARLSEMMEAEDDFMEREAVCLYTKMITIDEAGCVFSAKEFAVLHAALQRRLIKLILNYLFSGSNCFDFTRIEMIRSAVIQEQTSSLQLDISDRIRFIKEYDRIRIGHSEVQSAPFEYGIPYPYTGEIHIPQAGCMVYFYLADRDSTGSIHVPSDGEKASFNLDKLIFPLKVRSRLQGDRMEIVGLNGSKKVKDIFIDDKIAKSRRSVLPLLVDGNNRVLWIPGIRRSIHASADESANRILHVQVKFTQSAFK